MLTKHKADEVAGTAWTVWDRPPSHISRQVEKSCLWHPEVAIKKLYK